MRKLRVVTNLTLCLLAFNFDGIGMAMKRVVPPTPQTSQPLVQRTVVHTEAYKRRDKLGPHLEIVVTPPEKRGHKGYLLVEVYNRSKTNVGHADFALSLANNDGYSLDAQISCANIRSGLSALKWIKIPGDGSLPKITAVNVANMRMSTDQSRALTIPFTTDLIKK